MGGDEFVLVLPGLPRAALTDVLKKLETVVVDAGFAVCGERLLNISIGAVFCPEHGTDAESLLAEADRRMYLVKQTRKRPNLSGSHDIALLAASLANPDVPAGSDAPKKNQSASIDQASS
jgi:GGDEF domain-containing protein